MAVILMALIMMVGCQKTAEQTTAPAAQPAAETEVVATTPTASPDAAVVQAKDTLSYEGSDPAVQRFIKACEAGNLGVCTTLRTKYGIDMKPKSAAAKEAAEPAEAVTQ